MKRGWALLAGLLLAGSVFAQSVPDGANGGDRRILTANDLAQRGDLRQLEILAASPSTHPLEPYVGYWLLSKRLARGEIVAPQTIRDYLSLNEGVAAERMRSEWLKRIGRDGPWTLFNEEYVKLQQPDIELQCFAIRARSPGYENALQLLEAQWLTLMDTPESCSGPLQSLVDSGRKTSEDVLWRLRRLVEANRLSGARQTLNMLPASEAPDPAVLGQIFDNPDRFLASAAARGASSRAARELVLAAIARTARGDARGAMSRWRALDETRYSAAERAYAMSQIAWGAAIAQMPEANGWFAIARSASPTLVMGEEQSAWQVRAALRAGDWPTVQSSIESMSTGQRSQPDWNYWLARALSMQGRPQEARPLHERYAGEPNFYGILSAEAIGRSLTWPLPAQAATVPEIQAVESTPAVQRSLAFFRLDMRTEALREWNWAMRGADDRFLIAAAEFARRQGIYDRAIYSADRTRLQHDYSLRYLAPYYDIFARESRARQLDLHWVYGLTRQESRFVTAARSAVGAQGVMQVMPATGSMVARQIGLRGYQARDLAQPETNVQLGTAYLRSVLDSLANSPVMATAAYNAGPGRARRWRDSKPLEAAIYAETIPISETRDYVKKVMANTIAYAVLFDGKPMSMTRFMGTIPSTSGDLGSDAPQ